MSKRIKLGLFIFAICFLLVGCGNKVLKVHTIDAEEAKRMMTKEVVILDVRTKTEYIEGHIKDAINIPLDSIREENKKLPNKDAIILVYCRSGNRSKTAAEKLVSYGYTNVYDFGGILDWPYEIVQK